MLLDHKGRRVVICYHTPNRACTARPAERTEMNLRHTDAARDFAAAARIFALARGSVSEARRLAYETGNSRVVDVFERAEPGSLGGTSPQWGEELGSYRQSAEGFVASLRADSAFDAALPFMVRVPFQT